ncbi:hypothetical protein [Mycobacterium terramassiliense]|nr:hypothetical protein [Mycobacterium terramassiliense]
MTADISSPTATGNRGAMQRPARWLEGLAAAVAALVFWPQSSVDPGVGLNPSWQAGPALARAQDLEWGPGLVFTYGPLAFLQHTPYYSFGQSVLATIYQPVVVAALFLGIATVLRQRCTRMTSLMGAFATTGVVAILHTGHGLLIPGLEYPELAILAAFVWAAAPLLQEHPKRTTVFATCTVLAAVAGLELLVKLNVGVTILVIALTVSVLLEWRDVGRHCATVAVFAASTLIWWVLAGQRLGNLPAWLKSSASLVAGYSDAMAYPLFAFAGIAAPAMVLILVWLAMLGLMFFKGGAQTPRRFVLFVGIVTLIIGKKEFVRLDLANFYDLLALVVLALVIAPLSSIPKIPRRAFVVFVVAIVLAGLGAESSWLRTAGTAADDPIAAAVQAPGQAIERLITLAVPGRVDQRIERAKTHQRALYAIPDRFIKTIGSATVHIDPNETSVAWAYNFAWRPVPVFQTYAAYTPTLDALNSRSFETGPQFVLSRLSANSPATDIDGRLAVQESPRYSRALLCDYTVNGVEGRWALFAHAAPRCGPLTELSQVTVHGNDTITVPAPRGPDKAILARIDMEPTVIDRLFRGTIVPLTLSTVVLDGVTYRLVAANAAEAFLVDTPASVDGTNLQIHARTIGVGRAPSLGQGDPGARLHFYEMSVAP